VVLGVLWRWCPVVPVLVGAMAVDTLTRPPSFRSVRARSPRANRVAFEQALALAAGPATAAYEAQEGWADRVRAGLFALLEFFDQEPALARLCVLDSAQAGPAVLARRSEVLDRLARVLDDERAPARGYPPPLTAQAVVNGVLGVLHQRLQDPSPGARWFRSPAP
jgi:hypothetical protein